MAIQDNRLRFERALRGLRRTDGSSREDEDLLFRIAGLVAYAQRSGCGYYSSPEIECALYAMACDEKRVAASPEKVEVEVGHCLIVMSEAYAVGGHTRVVERWIELDDGRRYSLALTRQGARQLPDRLVTAVKRSGGEILQQDVEEDVFRRAAELRMFAARFDKIVLHIHTDDVIPLLAFGTERFTRPVGLYNHADHLFWLGVGIADGVGELRKSKLEFSRRLRGIECTQFVGIPMDAKERVRPNRMVAKAKLGISEGTPVIATCGSATKYDPALGKDFLPVARRILKENPTAVLVGIGMTFRDLPEWKRVSEALGGRIRVMGLVPFERLYDYYDAADLYLDSYPIGGGTAMPDALCRGCPVLSLPSPDGKMDWIYDCGGYCETEDEIVRRASKILRGDEDVQALVEKECRVFDEYNAPPAFLGRLQAFMDALSGPHRVRGFAPGFDGFSDLDRYHFAEHTRQEYVFGDAESAFACYYREDPIARTKILRAFGYDVTIKRRVLAMGMDHV